MSILIKEECGSVSWLSCTPVFNSMLHMSQLRCVLLRSSIEYSSLHAVSSSFCIMLVAINDQDYQDGYVRLPVAT